jgi:hypothetical protein
MRKHTILFLAPNPSEIHHLALDREAREIQVELECSRGRARFELVTRWAAEPLDLLRLAPTVVQFNGHSGHLAADAAHVGPRSGRDVVSSARCVTLIQIERSAQSTTTRRSLPRSLAFLTQTCGTLVVPLSPTGQP